SKNGSQPLVSMHWNREDASKYLHIHEDLLTVTYVGPGVRDFDSASLRTNYPIRSEMGISYFEINIIDDSRLRGGLGIIGIGLGKRQTPIRQIPGWFHNRYDTIGYHGDDGLKFRKSDFGEIYVGATYGTGDVIGCGINYIDRNVFFTKNGINLG
ncbi:8502_t:CDS:2, partial [Acaulospora morrowiae]